MKKNVWSGIKFPIALLLFAFVLAGCFGPPAGSGFGSISVTSEPSGARVFLNGEDTGQTTPTILENVKVGSHTVGVEVAGFAPQSQSVAVTRSQTANVTFDLEAEEPGEGDRAIVSGIVSENKGGRNLSGATVTAYETGTDEAVTSTTTDVGGRYSLKVPAGVYDIVVDKEGHGQGKRQALSVDEGDVAKADLIAKVFRDPAAGEPVAPTLQVYLEGGDGDEIFEPGVVVEYDSAVRGLVVVDAAYDVYRIQARIGHRDHGADFEAGILQSQLQFLLWDFFDAPGDTELIVTAYDYQGNWAEMTIPFTYGVPTFEEDEEPIELQQVKNVKVLSVTYGHDLGLYRQGRAETFAMLGIDSDPDLFDLGDGTFIDLSRLDKDVTMYTALTWSPVYYEDGEFEFEVSGYEIERSFNPDRGWRSIGKVGDWFEQPYMDFSPELTPGKSVYYRVRAIGPHDEKGPWSKAVSVIPLDRLEVLLVDPADDATGVSLEPTLRWEHTDVGAQVYRFDGFVSGVTGVPGGFANYYAWTFEDLFDTTEVVYNFDESGEPLKPAHTYQWNILDAEASAVYGPNSSARSFAGTGLAASNGYAGAANGEFVFTTTHKGD